MSFKLNEIVPWGRSYEEYCSMFSLTPAELIRKILGCGDGPASFNAVCNEQGGNVVSIDPLYAFTKQEIAGRIEETFTEVITQTKRNLGNFVWNRIGSVDELGQLRMQAMNKFLATYEEGRTAGKYVSGSLPRIDFPDNHFDIALSSHFLFLYSKNLTLDFHIEAIGEMLRVAPEVRIFPLVDLNAETSPYIDPVIRRFGRYAIKVRKVDYEFQIGGNEMMVISRNNLVI